MAIRINQGQYHLAMGRWLLLVGLATVSFACEYLGNARGLVVAGAEAEKKGDLERAIRSYTRAIDSGKLEKSLLHGAYVSRGNAYAMKQRFEEARADFDAAIALVPGDANGYFNRGRIAQSENESQSDFDTAIKLDPQHVDAYYERGALYDRLGRLDRAMSDYSSALRINPKHVDALVARGRLHHLKSEFDNAVVDYDAAISANPKLDHIFVLRGGSYYEKQMFSRARDDLDNAVRLNPTNSYAFSTRGAVKAAQEDYVGAVLDFNAALALSPDDEDKTLILVERGRAYRQKGDLQQALDDTTDAIRLNSGNAEAFRQRGIVLREMNLHERALDDFDAAVRRDPKNLQNLYSRALERFYVGQFSMSVSDLRKVLELKPDHEFAKIFLYLAESRAGEKIARTRLAESAKAVFTTPWVRKIAQLLAGDLGADEFLRAAQDSNSRKDREQHCEAYFYLGQRALLQGDRSSAIKYFRLSLDTGVHGFVEYTGAKADLQRLERSH